MTDNKPRYGWRWFKGAGGRPHPVPHECFVVSGQSFDVNGGAQNVSLGPGDLVTRLASGAVSLAAGAEGAGGMVAPWGVVIGVAPYYDAVAGRMTPSNLLPDAVAYSTNLERQSKVWVVPVEDAWWEVDCDDAATATTLAAFQLLVGLNADMRHAGAVGETRANPRLDISSAAVTATLGWRIEGISPTVENQDFSGNYVKLLVRPNVAQQAPFDFDGI